MKGTERFTEVIEQYLDKKAEEDAKFNEKYSSLDKSIEKCVDYIITQVRDSGRNAFSDDEIFGMAVHYFDEDSLPDAPKAPGCEIICATHEYKLSDEEKKEIEEEAKQHYFNHVVNEMRSKADKAASKPKKAKAKVDEQPSLFD